MDKLTLSAGVARIDITPPVGFRMQGLMRRSGPSVGVESPLHATALVLADEETKVVVVDCDLIGLDLPLANTIRQAIGDRVQTHAHNVMVGCTHTHNGPCTSRGNLGGPHHAAPRPGEIEALDEYIDDLVVRLAKLAGDAYDRRRPARSATARGYAAVSINREELAEDGRVLVGRNPDGPTDQTVDLLRIDDLEGHPIAVLTGYAAHPVVMGMNDLLISPDFPGVVRRTVEKVTGATCLYMTGAAGNQATISFLQDDWGEQERIGGIVGSEAARVFFEIETRPHEVVRNVGESLANLALYHKSFRNGPTHRILKAARREATVPLQPLPSIEQAKSALDEATATLIDMESRRVPPDDRYPTLLVKVWAERVLKKVQAGQTEASLSFDITGFRLDDFVLVGMPGEPFVEIGLAVKELSQAKHTMFAGYCNGTVAYWPTPDTVAHGGMAVEAAVKTYGNPTPPVAETVALLVTQFSHLLKDLDA
jgi:hypothetical protein